MVDHVASLIEAANDGDPRALQALFTYVYGELKILARKQLARSGSATLNTTALVHEAYLKLSGPEGRSLHGRVHFFALAAKAMRQIVMDHARARLTGKRGGGELDFVDLEDAFDVADGKLSPDDLVVIDRALTLLAEDEPELADLVELRFFGGLALPEIALLRDVSERTLSRDWRRAKAQLYVQLHPDA
ncbi:MAG TPA: ECF-type sigma factor [Rhodanobacteraceae bacterium]|jgi:RNA polymerase sigma factor (TIGR02999 family)|nr:ECF-type sigma factor [Rhodanobacteraceae bacterium]